MLGPEAPLIAIGSGLGVLAVHLFKRDAPATAAMVIGGAGSFAAISTLLGSPLAGAFLLMEAAGLGGAMTGVVLVPGLLAAGIGSLIFVGLDSWTGLGTFSIAVPDIPVAGTPTLAQFLWAIVIGVLGAFLGAGITRSALFFQPIIERRRVLLMPVVGLVIGVSSLIFVSATDKPPSAVLFSGQDQLAPLINEASSWTVGALLLVVLCKSVAYGARAHELPWRAGLPQHVHRCRWWNPVVASARPADDRRCRDGHRRDGRGDAGPAAGVGAARRAVAASRRAAADTGRDRGRRRLLRRLRPTPTGAPADRRAASHRRDLLRPDDGHRD